MTHVTCRLTAKYRDQLRNPTLGNRVWATFTPFYLLQEKHNLKRLKQLCGLNGQHRTVLLTRSQNVTQQSEYKILGIYDADAVAYHSVTVLKITEYDCF